MSPAKGRGGRGRRTASPPPKPPRPPRSPRPPKPGELGAPAPSAPGPVVVPKEEIRIQFEQRPPLLPLESFPPPPHRAPDEITPRRLAFVLHAHLPWVLGHGTWPHGEDWLAEAVTHCYLPILDAIDRLAARGRRDLLAFEVTPVLLAMLADARCETVVERYLDERTKAAWESRRAHPLALWWHGEFERLRAIWNRFDHDLVATLARLAETGAIELATSAGTHVYLPLAHGTKLARLALRTGREQHRERFGDDPLGCWMPECAYRPGGPWRHPVTGAVEERRPGNEELLAEQGIRWTVVDAHLLRRGDPAFPYGADLPPDDVVEPSGPHPRPYWIRQSAVAAFLRDARSAAQVWSRQGGYPGDGAFLDFHKRHWPSGLRLWRVTGADVDLADKLVYWPEDAQKKALEQAEHFLELAADLPGMDDGLVTCPFDAELFGHWWFEGPIWLERVLELASSPASGSARHPKTVEATTPARELAARPTLRHAFFAEGSWGAGGDHRVWVNDQTEWIWRELGDLERLAWGAVRWGGSRRWRRAILNQLLLAAASDWPFLITMETGRDYAEERFREHAARLRELVQLGPRARTLPGWVEADLPFPDLEPEWALPPET
jgi:1,4-alpha-glucan branching enzyme